MSLIDQALKRAQAAQQDAAASLAARPWAPTPLPDRRRARRRRMWQVLSATFLLGILVTAAFFFGRAPGRSRSQVGGASAGTVALSQRAARKIAPVSPSPAIASEVFVAPPPRGPGPSRGGHAPLPAARQPAASVVSVREAGAQASSDKAVQAPAEARHAPVFSDGKTYVGEVTLPGGERIELGGIVFSETNPVALINGRVIGAGRVVGGFTVAEIQPDRVKLEGEDGTIWIRLK